MKARHLPLIGTLCMVLKVHAQTPLPDGIFGKSFLPVWTQVEAPSANRFMVRTYYMLPIESSSNIYQDRVFRGVGRAYYGEDGRLLWAEDGYGGVRCTCAHRHAFRTGNDSTLTVLDSLTGQPLANLTFKTEASGRQEMTTSSPGKKGYKIDWEDRIVTAIKPNPCR